MNSLNFNYITYNKRSLEEWMLFALALGEYLELDKKNSTHKFSIYFSLPEPTIFSYFLLHGIFNAQMQQDVDATKIIERFKQLKEGDIIYYLDHDEWKRCSVVGLYENYTQRSPFHLGIANHSKVIQYIPYHQWEERVMVTDKSNDKILNARRLTDIKKVSGPLSQLYRAEKVKLKEMINLPSAYIVGNKSEFDKYLSLFKFSYAYYDYYYSDILKDGESSHFCNIKWLHSNTEYHKNLVDESITVIIGAAKATYRMDEFGNSNRIIFSSLTENVATVDMLQDKIEQEILIKQGEVITNEIVEELREKSVAIPKGVRFIAWQYRNK